MEEQDIKRISKNSPMAQIELIKSESFKCIAVSQLPPPEGGGLVIGISARH